MKPLGTQHIAEFLYCKRTVLNHRKSMETILKAGIEKAGLTLISIQSHQFHPVGFTVIAIIGESHIAVHTYPEARHASLDIFTCSSNPEPHFELLKYLKTQMKPKTVRVIELIRGNPIEIKQQNWIVSFTAYGFEIRYHIVKSFVSQNTEYHKIDIIENDSFGRMLFLDRDVCIAESDADMYSMTLVDPIFEEGDENEIEDVAILGLEDGGCIARELLKYPVRHISVVESDHGVIDGVQEHLKNIHNKSLMDPRVNLIEEDILDFFRKAKSKFDAIIYNYSMHPESRTRLDRNTFLHKLFRGVIKSLDKGGYFSLQCCSEYDVETLKLLKRLFNRYFEGITFQKAFIPSYCENWIFASARLK